MQQVWPFWNIGVGNWKYQVMHILTQTSFINCAWVPGGDTFHFRNWFPDNHLLKVIKCRLTHWGRVTHICVSKITIIESHNGMSPGRRKAIIGTNDGILVIGISNFGEIFSKIHIFSFKNAFENVVCEMAVILSRPQCVNHVLPGSTSAAYNRSIHSEVIWSVKTLGWIRCMSVLSIA